MNRKNRYVTGAALEALENRQLLHAPTVDVIPNYNVPGGKTVQVPITTTYDHADKVTYKITDNSTGVTTTLRSTSNTFIQMNVQGYAQPMVFQLFDDIAPDTVRRLKGLINAGYYDNLTFHRVINNFVIQGGDPAGDGSGGPGYQFDDEFNPNAIFSGDGQLAMANSGKDTNGSQFFITEGPQRFLDFNHTIFGQLVRGKTTRDSISDISVDSSSRPNSVIRITSVRIIQNTTDAVLQVKVNAGSSGVITVRAITEEGQSSRSFTVTGVTDSVNDPPILTTTTPVYYTAVNTALSIKLKHADLDAGTFTYGADLVDGSGLDLTKSQILPGTGVLTIVPKAGFVGKITLYVGVNTDTSSRGSSSANTNLPLSGIYDSQLITIAVGEQPIVAKGVNVQATTVAPATDVPVATFTDADTKGTAANFTAKINWGDGSVTTGKIIKAGSTYTVYGTKAYGAAAQNAGYPITVDISGNLGAFARTTSTANVVPFAVLKAGVVSVYGTSANDRIGIGAKGSNYTVTVNGQTRAFAKSQVTKFNAFGFDGSDLIQLVETGIPGSYLEGGEGNDALYGSDGDDTINAGGGRDTVFTRAGYNRVAGGDGHDTITGGIGRDRLFGGTGNDYIDGGAGRDILGGDEGNDTLLGGASNDSLYGNDGDDLLNGLNGADYIDGGPGKDTTKVDVNDTRIAVEVLNN